MFGVLFFIIVVAVVVVVAPGLVRGDAVPVVHVGVTTVFTNTVPTDAYRGAGRPEACYVLERLADAAARELGLDRAEIRRRNLITADTMPYTTPIGPIYDCGDFPNILEKLLAAADSNRSVERGPACPDPRDSC